MESIFALVFIVALTFLSAFFSSSETALFSLSSTKVRAYHHSKDSRKRLIGYLLDRPQDLLVTVFILNTVVNVLLQNAVSGFVGDSAGWMLKVGVPFLILVFFGEILPKQFGLEKNDWLAQHVAPPIAFFQRSIHWIKEGAVLITSPLSRALFFFLRKDSELSSEELKHALEKSKEMGILDALEAELAYGYLEMSQNTVNDIMRPKEEILAYDIDEPLSKATHLLVDQECSRIPVYEGSLDKVLGLLSAREYFIHRDQIHTGRDLIPFLEKIYFCPEGAPAKLLFKQLDEHGEIFSLAVNEYGVVSGLITKEDLIEMVIGAISDRRDTKSYYSKVGAGAIIAFGQMEIEELEDFYGVILNAPENIFTIGGFLTDRIGDIPKVGDTYKEGGLEFKVLAAEPNRVKKVYISRGKDG